MFTSYYKKRKYNLRKNVFPGAFFFYELTITTPEVEQKLIVKRKHDGVPTFDTFDTFSYIYSAARPSRSVHR